MRKKDNLFAFRVNDENAERINRNIQQSGLTMNDYLTSIILKGKVISSIDSLKFRAVYDELRRQGNNLNQIARHLNSGEKDSPDYKECVRVFKELLAVCRPQKQ